MVGQSVMWAIVTVSLLGSPPQVYKLGEGSSSLNHPLNHCPVPQSYSTLKGGSSIVTCLCFLSLDFQGVGCELEDGLLGFCNDVCWMCMFWICCHLWRNSCRRRICSVVCLSSSGRCLSFCGMMSCGMRVR